jgi:peptidoglycan/xylan/chitin deacetylase (PgdA/CDA1 family)
MAYAYTYRRRRRSFSSGGPLVAFLIVASFGILFAGCGAPKDDEPMEEFTFTADDVARFRELTGQEEGSTTSVEAQPYLDAEEGGIESEEEMPVLDLSLVSTYDSIRSGPAATGEDLYRVTNTFLNVRSAPNVTADSSDRLDNGDVITVLEFVDAAWAHVRLPNGREGYVAQRYIAKLTSEAKLAEEKEKFKDLYIVEFGFLNVRKAPDGQSDKIGELPGQAFVKVLSKDDVWARIPFESGEGYVAVQYLSPFLPNFLVRQEQFALPVLHYRLEEEGTLSALPAHLDLLKQEGYQIITLRDFRTLLLEQEERDVRLEPRSVALVISGITPENVTELSDVLRSSNVKATLCVQTQYVGLTGITEKTILTLQANGHDIQSGGHTGDDLRSLTNAQVELELKQSRKILEQYTRKPVFAIAYPLGGANARVEAKAVEAGYLLGVGAAQERTFQREQFLRLPAFVISSSATAEEVLGLVKGE